MKVSQGLHAHSLDLSSVFGQVSPLVAYLLQLWLGTLTDTLLEKFLTGVGMYIFEIVFFAAPFLDSRTQSGHRYHVKNRTLSVNHGIVCKGRSF